MSNKSLFLGLLCVLLAGCTSPRAGSPPAPRRVLVYCCHCGVVAGKPTSCPNGLVQTEGAKPIHEFMGAKPSSGVACTHCGAVPGPTPTLCPDYTSHDFQEFAE